MQNRNGPNRAGPFGLLQSLADGIKVFFKEAFLPARADKRLYRLAPVPVARSRLHRLLRRPHRRHLHHRPPHHPAAAGRPPVGHPVRAHDVVDRRVRRHAGRLVVGVEVPAARLGAGVGPDGLLRGGPRIVRGHRRAAHRLPAHQRHRGQPARVVPRPLEHHPDRRRPVLHLPDRRHRRDEPSAVRPGRSRGGDRRRLHGRVLVDRFRLLLPGRVRQRHHQLGHHRDPVPRRSRRPQDRRSQHRDRLVPPQGVRLPFHLRVVPGHPAPLPLRPAHGSRLEAAHPRVARLVADRGRVPSRQRLVGPAHGRARDRRRRPALRGPWPSAAGPQRSRPRTERAA